MTAQAAPPTPEAARADDVVVTHDLSKRYKGVDALQGLNLRVPRHSIFGFLGPNGAGKSTTIKLLLGLAQPTAGRATVFGHDVVRESVAVRERSGYLAQDPRFYEHMTARETLHFAARFFYAGPTDLIEARVAESLELVGLDGTADRAIRGFSDGERQRLGIAQALVNQPDLLILDEPAASLDPMGRRDVLAVMERLRSQTTIFYSTHILDDVQRVSDTVAIMNRGRLVAHAPVEQLLSGGAVTYSVTLTGTAGALDAIRERVAAQPWVGAVHLVSRNGVDRWQVGVTDESAADTALLALITDDRQATVSEFGCKKQDLEAIFMQIVKGTDHGR